MTKLISILTLLLVQFLTAQTFEQDIQKSIDLWQNKQLDEALTSLENLNSTSKDAWLKDYYIGLIHVNEAYQKAQNKKEMIVHLEAADKAILKIYTPETQQVEILILVGMLQTAYIVYNPMQNAMNLSGEINELYQKALTLEPNNPRAILQKAQFDMGTAKYFNRSTQPMCNDIKKSIQLFDTFEVASSIHPNWGKDQAETLLKNSCN